MKNKLQVIELLDPSVNELKERLNELEKQKYEIIFIYGFTSWFLKNPYTRIIVRKK